MTQESEAQPVRGFARVVSNEVDGPGRKLLLEMDEWPGGVPGQFVMVGAGALASVPRQDPLLPRPMAVYRQFQPAYGGSPPRLELLYRIVGRGTALLGEATEGDRVSLVGPLGRGFPLTAESAPGRALLVGGGTGIASLYELAQSLVGAGRPVSVLLGARSEADRIGVDDFDAIANSEEARSGDFEVVWATEDGSAGERGFVTRPLEDRLVGQGAEATVFACGPTPMMRAAAELAADRKLACFVSLENPMACGFGVCLGCAAPRMAGGFSLVCREGPVFDATEIDWEGLP